MPNWVTFEQFVTISRFNCFSTNAHGRMLFCRKFVQQYIFWRYNQELQVDKDEEKGKRWKPITPCELKNTKPDLNVYPDNWCLWFSTNWSTLSDCLGVSRWEIRLTGRTVISLWEMGYRKRHFNSLTSFQFQVCEGIR